MTTLLIADDHPLFREALRGVALRLLPEADIREADNAAALYALVEAEPDADLLLLDLNMPGVHGFSALVLHPKVAEAAVVGFPHDLKGQGIYAYVTLVAGEQETEDLRKELVAWVRKEIGPIATPDFLQWAPGLPKTRSGKIMRRILRKIAEDAPDQLGDPSTLADPSVVDSLVKNRKGS